MEASQSSDDFGARRRLLKAALLGGLAAAAPPVGAMAQDRNQRQDPAPATLPAPARPMPVVDARFPAEMAPGVFVLPDKRIPLVPNIGIVVGRDSVLVVDCGLGIGSAEEVLALARRLAPGRRIVLTVTHAHPEHGFGAQVFKPDARIYYNAAQRDHLLRSARTLLDGFRAVVLPPAQRHLLDGIAPPPPDQTYDGSRATLDLGGRIVEFRTWGTAHSPGDQIVLLPEERIVFAGDLIEERMFPIVPFFPPMIGAGDIDLARWETTLADILSLQPRLIVPGHGNLGGPEIAEGLLGYFRELRAMLRAAGQPGPGLEASIRARYPTWENAEYIAPATRYLSQAG
ncbi:MBL fold metallo-hydrolase [Arenibaculum pallidiluteum]|uniref:MBL fold metallo-hydrolase n=1 Tax=Arenibaculum pallidiluteum TaxID=2812559 RepID=UPI001A971365|nr:MBL fold metallo-hydrolase [Arenibaculum pallidiluteum]